MAREGTLPLRISLYLFAQNAAVDRLEGYVTEGAGENLVASAGDYENLLAPLL